MFDIEASFTFLLGRFWLHSIRLLNRIKFYFRFLISNAYLTTWQHYITINIIFSNFESRLSFFSTIINFKSVQLREWGKRHYKTMLYAMNFFYRIFYLLLITVVGITCRHCERGTIFGTYEIILIFNCLFACWEEWKVLNRLIKKVWKKEKGIKKKRKRKEKRGEKKDGMAFIRNKLF